MSDTRESWVDMPKFSAVCFVGHDEDWLEWKGDDAPIVDPENPPVRISITHHGKRYPTTFNFTGMTSQELAAFKAFLVRAIEMAEPICERLDQKALEAFQKGDSSFARLYRPVPKLFIREQLQPEHSEGLQERPPRLVDVAASDPAPGVLRSNDGGLGDDSTGTDEVNGGSGDSGILAGERPGVDGEHPQP
jgi:hypothetical protein